MFYELFSFMNQTLDEIEQDFGTASDMDEELVLLEKYLSIKEMTEEIQYELSRLNNKIKQFEKEHGLDLDLDSDDSDMKQQNHNVENSFNPKKEKEPEVVIEIDENDFMNFQKGIGFFDLWMYDQAIIYLQRVIDKYPDFSLARLYTAMTYFKKKDYHKTKEEVSTLFEFSDDPDLVSLGHNLLGMIYGHEQEYNLAVEHFQQAIKLKNNWIEPKFNLAMIYYRAKQYEKTISVLNELYQINPIDWEVIYYIGKSYQQLNQIEEANLWLKRTYDVTKQPSVIKHIARNFEKKGEFQQASIWYQKWVRLQPNNSEALSNLGKTLWIIGDKQRGMALIKKSLAIESDNLEANLSYAWMLFDNEQKELAIEQLEKLLAKSSETTDTHTAYLLAILARLYAVNRDQKRSEEFCSLLFSSKDNWIRGLGHIVKGFIYLDEHKPERALEEFQLSQIEGINFPYIKFYQGYCYYLMGNIEDAKTAWQSLDIKGPEI